MKKATENDHDHVDLGVVAEFISKEANYWRSSEDTEGEDGVDESNINVADTDVLHVDGEVGEDGVGSAGEHEQSHLQRQQLLVDFQQFTREFFYFLHHFVVVTEVSCNIQIIDVLSVRVNIRN